MDLELKKTTVSFPVSVLKALRIYMAENNMGLHDQSKVVAAALVEYLKKRNIKIEDSDEVIEFYVELIK